MDFLTSQRLNWIRFSKEIDDYLSENNNPPMNLQNNQIRPARTGKIYTTISKKTWQPLIMKGNVHKNGKIYPFGYFDQKSFHN